MTCTRLNNRFDCLAVRTCYGCENINKNSINTMQEKYIGEHIEQREKEEWDRELKTLPRTELDITDLRQVRQQFR